MAKAKAASAKFYGTGNKDAVLGIINEENNKMKLRLTDKEK